MRSPGGGAAWRCGLLFEFSPKSFFELTYRDYSLVPAKRAKISPGTHGHPATPQTGISGGSAAVTGSVNGVPNRLLSRDNGRTCGARCGLQSHPLTAAYDRRRASHLTGASRAPQLPKMIGPWRPLPCCRLGRSSRWLARRGLHALARRVGLDPERRGEPSASPTSPSPLSFGASLALWLVLSHSLS